VAEDMADQPVEMIEGDAEPAQLEGQHDIRKASAGASHIIGTFGALAVPALFVLFSVAKSANRNQEQLVALAGGLLIVALLASIGGALGLNAIAAQEHPTGNLVPATTFVGVASALSLITVLGAFEVLASIYLPASTTLFAVITGVAGLMGGFLIAQGIADVPYTGPTDPVQRRAWQATQWIKSQQQADRHTSIAAGVSAIPAITGIALRIAGLRISPTSATVSWLVGSSLVLAMGSVVLSGMRLRHATDGPQKGLRFAEAYGSALVVSIYALVLMMLLPGAQTG
jgi:hypothetical protein